MAQMHYHPVQTGMERGKENRCAVMFCLTWIGFFAAIGAVTWVLSSL
jgi:hypothetical protein